MNKLKLLFKKLKTPSVGFSVLFSLLSIAIIASTIVFVILGVTAFWVYILYILSAMALTYEVYIVIFYAPKIRQAFINLAMKNKYTKSYIQNFGFRSLVSSSFGAIINIGFAVTQGVLAIITNSIWYGALAVYYILLSCIRSGIIIRHNQRKSVDDPNEYLYLQTKSYRNCGIYITTLTIALSGAIAQMVIANQGFKYAGIMIYVIASYTFYKLTLAIINIVKAKKNDDYTIQSARNLNLASALVSLLALQTAMFDAFGGGVNPSLANALTGTGVSLIIITLGLIMAIHGQKKLKQLKQGDKNG